MVQCFSGYDSSVWESNLELVESGKRLAWDMLIPMLLLGLMGSLKPLSLSQPSVSSSGSSFRLNDSLLRVYAPYTYYSSELVSSSTLTPPTTMMGLIPSLYTFDLSYVIRLALLSLLSPVAMDLLFNHFAPLFIQVCSRLIVVLIARKGPDADARIALAQRVKIGRVIRRHGYDLYLPPPPSPLLSLVQQPLLENNNDQTKSNVDDGAGPTKATGPSLNNMEQHQQQHQPQQPPSPASKDSQNKKIIQSLLFFPGFGICHSAYSDVASRMSDMGIPVAVVSLEPFRLAHNVLGGGMNDVKRLLKLAGKEVVQYYKRAQKNENINAIEDCADQTMIVEWALGGHSMGGYAVLQLGEELLEINEQPSITLRDGSISKVSNQLIVWAAGPFVDSVPDLRTTTLSPLSSYRDKSHTAVSKPLKVLILLASKDEIAKFQSEQQKLELLSKLPKRTTLLHTIDGGNHSGFASYNTATKKSKQSTDGTRDIPLEVQHVEACSRTVCFLLQK